MGPLSKFLFFVFWFSALPVIAQEYETILWEPHHRLSWSDFRGGVPESPRAAATTASGISYEFYSREKNGEYELDFTVNTFFYPEKSWYQPKICDDNILSHEQLHFDISELFARKMRRILAETRFTQNIKAEIKAIYRQINKELTEFQQVYDRETNFSRNREQQLIWNKEIAKALRDHRAGVVRSP